VEIYEKFWKAGTGTPHVAPPLVVYADLMTTGATGNKAAGKVIRANYLS
jgi:hypothetical protein